eukprot:SAG11_NODE_313_length_10878_cov_43.354578_1_plen_344_part_10
MRVPAMDPIKRWEPLPHDPLLDIKLRRDATPMKPRFFRTPHNLLPHLKEFVEGMMEAGFIQPSKSPFSAPILVIPKPRNADGSSRGFRLVTDFRQLNERVDPLQHRIPDVAAMYEKLRHAKFISTLDLKNGYWNAGLTKRSRRLTAFSTEFGCYEYKVVPQGLVCSAAHFQNWVEQKLRRHGVLFEHLTIDPSSVGVATSSTSDTQDKSVPKSNIFDPSTGRYMGASPIAVATLPGESGFVAVYIDDLIVFSDSEEEHERHLLEVMRICSEERLYLNNSKSKLFCKYTRYLGAVCGNNKLFMDPEKVQSITVMPTPKSPTQVREFLGAASFYRRWIASYAKITQ